MIVLLLGLITLCYGSQWTGLVQTNCGPVQGYRDAYLNSSFWSFKGIPYAIPPIGKLRWQPPISLKEGNGCWGGTFQADNFGSTCAQGDGSEDCLFLNIWAPENITSDASLPVMFYIHGGGLMEGSGNSFGETPWRAASFGDVISVSINYRLNAFGYLALNVLSKNDPRGTSGNYGLLDQILALQWVKDNIEGFGGNPNQVTLWGQSSGGTAIFQLLITPSAKDLFHGVISMSGSPNISVPLEYAEQVHVSDWLQQTPCNTTSEDNLLECLYSLSVDDIYNAITDEWDGDWLFGIPLPNSTISPLSIVDGVTVPMDIWKAFETGAVNDVPCIFGVMAQENDLAPVDVILGYTPQQFVTFIQEKFAPFGDEIADQVLSLYPLNKFDTPQEAYDSISADIGNNCATIALGNAASQGFNSKIYVYIVSETPPEPLCGVNPGYCPRYSFHMFDMLSAFDDYYPAWNFTVTDLKFSDLLMDHYMEFGKFGEVSKWSTFSSGNGGYNIINLNLNENVIPNYKENLCEFWHKNGFNTFFWQN